MNLFKIDVEKLRELPATFSVEVGPEAFALEDEDRLAFRDRVKAFVVATAAGKHVHLSGELTTVVTQECDRCLELVRIPIKAAVHLTYVNDKRLLNQAQALEHFDEDTVYYDGMVVEPRDQLRELLLVEVPGFPTCDMEKGKKCSFNSATTFAGTGTRKAKEVPGAAPGKAPKPADAWKAELAALSARMKGGGAG